MKSKNMRGYLWQVFDPMDRHWITQLGGIVVATVVSFLAPVKGLLFLTGMFVLADLYTGWRKTKKINGAVFNSKGMGKTLEKSVMYLILILVSLGIDDYAHLSGLLSLTYAVGGLIIGREALSIFENIDVVLEANFSEKIRSIFGPLKKKDKEEPKDP